MELLDDRIEQTPLLLFILQVLFLPHWPIYLTVNALPMPGLIGSALKVGSMIMMFTLSFITRTSQLHNLISLFVDFSRLMTIILVDFKSLSGYVAKVIRPPRIR